MKIERCQMPSFAVIGKEGSTDEGEGFIQRLWKDANEHFSEVQPIAQKDEQGKLLGIWGAMSDMSHSFMPWENGFTKGLYLAGIQCGLDAEPPAGWMKWIIPAYEYLFVENDQTDTFVQMIRYMNEEQILLAGAVHEFTCPETGKNFLFFPIKRL